MNLDIKKISNGYVVSLDGKETFFDIPEAICGHVAEWIQDYCKHLDAKPSAGMSAELAKAMQQLAQAQIVGQPAKPPPWTAKLLSDWD